MNVRFSPIFAANDWYSDGPPWLNDIKDEVPGHMMSLAFLVLLVVIGTCLIFRAIGGWTHPAKAVSFDDAGVMDRHGTE